MEDCPNCTLHVNPVTEWDQYHPDLAPRLRQCCPFCRHHLRVLADTPENVARVKRAKPTGITIDPFSSPQGSSLFD